MNLLLVTFELSETSRVLAWQARLARALAPHFDRVVAVTESLGEFSPPPNMEVVLLPRSMTGPLRLLGTRWLANVGVLRRLRTRNIDVCFVHMAAEWVYRLKPALAAAGVPVAMWYAHGTVSRRLRLAHACANRVLTSSPEGFRLPSRKLSIIGQGIDTDLFDVPLNRRLDPDIVYVGRISPRKRLDLAIRAFAEARRVEPQAGFQLTIVGPCLGAGDQAYKQELLRTATDLGVASHVNWRDYVPPAALPRLYESAFLHLNVSETGSLDKTVLEALSCGCAVLTNNSPFRSVLAPFPGMFVDSTDPIEIGERVAALYRGREQFDPVRLHGLIERDHSFTAYVGKVVRELQQLAVSEKSR